VTNTKPLDPSQWDESNTPQFAAAFGIPEGAPMALPAERRARVW